MSKIGRRINLLTIIASLFAVSCTTSENDGPSGNSRVISFTPNTVSRAVVSDANSMRAFSVWGWYGKGTQITNNVFDGVTVSKSQDNAWQYTDGGTRYWFPGFTYNFHAVYPVSLPEGTTVETNANTITITDFDCSKTGAEAVDLMTASRLAMSGDDAEQVALTFSHELTRLKFTVKSENTVATITSFKVYGVKYKGTLTKTFTQEEQPTTIWKDPITCNANDTPFQLDNFTFPTENSFEKNIFGDVLLIPNTDLTGATVAIAYRYPGETEDRTSSIILKNSTPSGWIAGKSYHYTLTIKGGSLTVTVKVVDWNEENTSVSWG